MSGSARAVMRELKQAVADAGWLTARTGFHQLADNMTDHLDDVVRQVRDTDKFDNASPPAAGTQDDHLDPDTGRPVSRGWVDPRGLRRLSDAATTRRPSVNLGNPGDDGGHLGAHRFFGDTPDQGIVPQDREPQPRRVEDDGE